jgi:hypothetical protein
MRPEPKAEARAELDCYIAEVALLAFLASRDLRLAAAFLCSTPFFTALSMALKARLSSCVEPSAPTLASASLYLRIAVLTEDFTEAFLRARFLLVSTLFFADLMFGTLRHLLRLLIARLIF